MIFFYRISLIFRIHNLKGEVNLMIHEVFFYFSNYLSEDLILSIESIYD